MSQKNLRTGWYMFCALEGQGIKGMGDQGLRPASCTPSSTTGLSHGEEKELDPQPERLQLPLRMALFYLFLFFCFFLPSLCK